MVTLNSRFGIPASHYRPSRTIIDQQHEGTKIEYDDTERSQLFHVEVAVSTAWLLSLFALIISCTNGRGGSLRGARQPGN